MPRYMVERTFPSGLAVPVNADGAGALRKIVSVNGEQGVTWVHSYVSADKTRTFCIYDAPTPEAIRQVARRNELPVGSITEVRCSTPTSTIEDGIMQEAAATRAARAAHLLVGAREPQHAEVVEAPAADLQADRQARRGVAAVDRCRRLLAHVERQREGDVLERPLAGRRSGSPTRP